MKSGKLSKLLITNVWLTNFGNKMAFGYRLIADRHKLWPCATECSRLNYEGISWASTAEEEQTFLSLTRDSSRCKCLQTASKSFFCSVFWRNPSSADDAIWRTYTNIWKFRMLSKISVERIFDIKKRLPKATKFVTKTTKRCLTSANVYIASNVQVPNLKFLNLTTLESGKKSQIGLKTINCEWQIPYWPNGREDSEIKKPRLGSPNFLLVGIAYARAINSSLCVRSWGYPFDFSYQKFCYRIAWKSFRMADPTRSQVEILRLRPHSNAQKHSTLSPHFWLNQQAVKAHSKRRRKEAFKQKLRLKDFRWTF